LRERGWIVDHVNLDDWIGKTVAVRFVPEGVGPKSQTEGGGSLESADVRGVMLGFQGEDEHNKLKQHYRFVPWHRVESIDLAAK